MIQNLSKKHLDCLCNIAINFHTFSNNYQLNSIKLPTHSGVITEGESTH